MRDVVGITILLLIILLPAAVGLVVAVKDAKVTAELNRWRKRLIDACTAGDVLAQEQASAKLRKLIDAPPKPVPRRKNKPKKPSGRSRV